MALSDNHESEEEDNRSRVKPILDRHTDAINKQTGPFSQLPLRINPYGQNGSKDKTTSTRRRAGVAQRESASINVQDERSVLAGGGQQTDHTSRSQASSAHVQPSRFSNRIRHSSSPIPESPDEVVRLIELPEASTSTSGPPPSFLGVPPAQGVTATVDNMYVDKDEQEEPEMEIDKDEQEGPEMEIDNVAGTGMQLSFQPLPIVVDEGQGQGQPSAAVMTSANTASKRKRSPSVASNGEMSEAQSAATDADEDHAPTMLFGPPPTKPSDPSPSANAPSPDPPPSVNAPVGPLPTGDAGGPAGLTELVTHLSRAVNHVVMKAFEEGLASRRGDAPDAGAVRAGQKSSTRASRSARESRSVPILREDSDFEEDGELIPKLKNKQRRARGQRENGKKNYHADIREFLNQKGLLPKKDEPLPESVSFAVLARFNREGRSAGPSLNESTPPRLDWSSSLTKDEWNSACIKVLAHQLNTFLFSKTKDNKGRYGAEKKKMELSACREEIVQRLSPVKTAVCKSETQRKEDAQLACRRMRRASRRTHRNDARKKTIDEMTKKHKHDNSTLWEDIDRVWLKLNGNGRETADGMSEDDSEIEETTRQKCVRLRQRLWINKAIPSLMHAVDTYSKCALDEVGHQRPGNSFFKRVEPSRSDDKCPYMVGLPRNFYDEVWYKNLDEVDKAIVGANETVIPIPMLPPYRYGRN